jgi:hypothetical protein
MDRRNEYLADLDAAIPSTSISTSSAGTRSRRAAGSAS